MRSRGERRPTPARSSFPAERSTDERHEGWTHRGHTAAESVRIGAVRRGARTSVPGGSAGSTVVPRQRLLRVEPALSGRRAWLDAPRHPAEQGSPARALRADVGGERRTGGPAARGGRGVAEPRSSGSREPRHAPRSSKVAHHPIQACTSSERASSRPRLVNDGWSPCKLSRTQSASKSVVEDELRGEVLGHGRGDGLEPPAVEEPGDQGCADRRRAHVPPGIDEVRRERGGLGVMDDSEHLEEFAGAGGEVGEVGRDRTPVRLTSSPTSPSRAPPPLRAARR